MIGCIVVSDHMLISTLSVSVEPMDMSCAEAVDALAPQAGDLKPEDLLGPLPESSSASLVISLGWVSLP